MKCIIGFEIKLDGIAGIIYSFITKCILFLFLNEALIDLSMLHGRKKNIHTQTLIHKHSHSFNIFFKFKIDILEFYWYKGYGTFAVNAFPLVF